MKRISGWEAKLNKAIAGMREREFEYGVSDCALMAADIVLEVAGIDPAAGWRNEYGPGSVPDDVEGLVAECAESAGMPEIPVRFAKRGDVVLMDLPGGPTVGVVDMTGRMAVFPRAPRGLVRLPALKCRRAWSV